MNNSNSPIPLGSEPRIRNCRFKYECDMHWNDLKETGRPNVRFCETCSKDVHFVRNRVDLALAIQKGLCVCVPHDIFDKQEKSQLRTPPQVIPDTTDRARNLEITLGVMRASPSDLSKFPDILEIPDWLRKKPN